MPKKTTKEVVKNTTKKKLKVYRAEDLINLKSSEAELIDATDMDKFYVCYPLDIPGTKVADANDVKFAYKLSEVMEQIVKK